MRILAAVFAFIFATSCSIFSDKEVERGLTTSDEIEQITKVKKVPKVVYNCQSAKEYITIYNFLKDQKEPPISGSRATEVSEQVVAGCTGAARRFIKVYTLLMKVEVGLNQALKNAVYYSNTNDGATRSFVEVFKHAYLKERLDLSAVDALGIAHRLSKDVDRRVYATPEKSYKKLADYCVSPSGLGMSRPQCAVVAARVSEAGLGFDINVGELYEEGIRFLTDEEGPNLAKDDARGVVEKLILVSPWAVENYRSTFLYAHSEDGLQLDRKKANDLAFKIAKLTTRKY